MLMNQNPRLAYPPLTYVLAQIKISPIWNIESWVPKLQEAIRKDFPYSNESQVETIVANSLEANPGAKVDLKKIWHFADKSKTSGILLDKDAVTIHTTHYETFGELLHKFITVLVKFHKELNITICTRIGLRYVNLIRENPHKYIHKGLLGFPLSGKEKFLNKYASSTETIQQTSFGFLKIKTIFGENENETVAEIPKFIPTELIYPASFLLHKKLDVKKSIKNYVVLDIDHFSQENFDFSVKNIEKMLNNFHELVYTTFRYAITEQAYKEWS